MTKEKEYNLTTQVHTVEMVAIAPTTEKASELSKLQLPYIISPNIRVRGRVCKIPINPHTFRGYEIYKYDDLIAAVDDIRDDFRLDEWNFNRVDIAIDSPVPYRERYKLNKMFASLFFMSKGNDNNFYEIRGCADLEYRNIYAPTRKIELSIYDRGKKTNGEDIRTRIEFRFSKLTKKQRTTVSLVFKELISLLDNLTKQWDKLTELKIDTLYNLWTVENGNGRISTLTEFYRKYSDELFTIDISRGLYQRIKGDVNKHENWMRDFRRKNKMHFISKAEMYRYVVAIQKSIKTYMGEKCVKNTLKSKNKKHILQRVQA